MASKANSSQFEVVTYAGAVLVTAESFAVDEHGSIEFVALVGKYGEEEPVLTLPAGEWRSVMNTAFASNVEYLQVPGKFEC